MFWGDGEQYYCSSKREKLTKRLWQRCSFRITIQAAASVSDIISNGYTLATPVFYINNQKFKQSPPEISNLL